MHKKHTPKQMDGFAKYRARHHRGARKTLLLLPPAKQRALRRNLMFIGVTLGLILLIALVSKAHAAGGAYGSTTARSTHRALAMSTLDLAYCARCSSNCGSSR